MENHNFTSMNICKFNSRMQEIYSFGSNSFIKFTNASRLNGFDI